MKRTRMVFTAAAMALVSTIVVLASGTVRYTGQGFTYDPENQSWTINDERCGLMNETPANDGGTGQFANWNGPGDPYRTGQSYLVWVLTANGATSATLAGGPFGAGVNMIKVGGTFKYATPYYSPAVTINVVYATWTGGPSRATLTVSHGCSGFTGGAWCSPGFWRNTLNFSTNAWGTIGVDPATTMFNGNVSTSFYANNISPDQLLTYVLNHPQDFGGQLGTAGPYGLTAFNAVGAYLTSLIPGYSFDPSLVGTMDDSTCPLDAHGAFKQ